MKEDLEVAPQGVQLSKTLLFEERVDYEKGSKNS